MNDLVKGGRNPRTGLAKIEPSRSHSYDSQQKRIDQILNVSTAKLNIPSTIKHILERFPNLHI